jgi:hypothetical protein
MNEDFDSEDDDFNDIDAFEKFGLTGFEYYNDGYDDSGEPKELEF